MSLATDLQGDVANLLNDPDFGRTATFISKAGGSYDETTGAITVTSTNYSVRVMLLTYRDGLVDGELIRRGDRKAIMKAKGFNTVPKTDDQLLLAGVTYNVIASKPIELTGVYVLFTLQIRIGG